MSVRTAVNHVAAVDGWVHARFVLVERTGDGDPVTMGTLPVELSADEARDLARRLVVAEDATEEHDNPRDADLACAADEGDDR